MYDQKNIGINIKRIIRKKGIKKYQLAQQARISRSTLDEIIKGHSDPRISTLTLIATALGCTVENLLTGSPTDEQTEWAQLREKLTPTDRKAVRDFAEYTYRVRESGGNYDV